MVCDEPDSLNQALEWLLGRNFKHVERGPPPPDIAEMMDKLESQPLERLGLITSLDGYTYLGHETCSGEWRCQMDTCAEYLADRAQWYEHVADCHKTWLREFKEGAAQQLIALEFDRKHRCLTPPFPKAVHDDATFCTLWEEICESVPEQSDAVHYERRPGRVSILHYAFFKAVESGDTGLVNVALDRSLDVNYSHFEQGTALVIAIKNANLKMAKLLLKRGADPFQRAESLPPLFHVIQNTKCGPAWLEMLLDNGVSLEAEAGPQRYSALHFLVIKDRDDLLETFISKGVCLGRVDIEDVTPLHMATSRGNLACVTALLEHGADRNARAKDGQGVLHFAAAQKRIDVLKFWLEQGVDINMQDYSGQTALFTACAHNSLAAVDVLLQAGADAEIVGPACPGCSSCCCQYVLKNYSIVMVAAQKNNPEVLKILASHGCDLERKSECNKTALDVAVAHKNNESVSFLLEAMDPNTHYPKNSVALQIAMSSRYSEVECLMTAASLMYPYVGFKFETPGQYAWVEWVLNEGGPLVKPAAMRKLMNTAIDNDNCELLQALIANGCEVNTCLYDGFTPLAHAVRGRSPSMTKLLLDAGADPNVRPHPLISSSKGITPFYEAITSMQNAQGTEIVGILLQSGRCRLNQSMGGTILQGPSYSTAFRGGLLRATTWGDEILTRFVMRIVAAVQDIDGDRTDEGHTFLHAATVYGMVEFINLLLDKGAKLEAIDKEGRTPFLMACCLSPMAVPLLLSKGANICAKTIRNHSALALAAKYGHVEVIRLLIEHGLDIESKGDDGYTPLASALRHGHEQVALELLALGASVDWKTENQETALHLAASSRIPGVVAELLRRGLDLEAKNDMGCTPLYLACHKACLEIVEMLVDAGANIESESSYKTRPRPLHAAIGYPEMPGEREKIACLLMERGANILALDSYGHTPLHMAAFVGFSEVVRKLLAMGANVEAQSAWQRTPLHLCYSIASFHLIIDHGAKLEAQDKRGFTPLHRAVECLNYRVAQALLAAGASPNIRARHDSRTVWDRVEDIANEDERTRFFFLLQMPPSWRKKGSEDGFEIIGRAEAVE